MNFHEAAEHFETDKGPRLPTKRPVPGGVCGHGYTFAYDRELPAAAMRTRSRYDRRGVLWNEPLGRPFSLLEVGVQMGCSMKLWDWYLARETSPLGSGPPYLFPFFGVNGEGPPPRIVGVERLLVPGVVAMVKATTKHPERIWIVESDSTDPALRERLERLWTLRPEDPPACYDVVIDDGSHLPADQVATLRNLWPLVAPGGIYCIEDLHESWWPDMAERGTIEPMLDQFWRDVVGRGRYAEWSGVPSKAGPPTAADDTFASVRFYRNLVVLEKAVP